MAVPVPGLPLTRLDSGVTEMLLTVQRPLERSSTTVAVPTGSAIRPVHVPPFTTFVIVVPLLSVTVNVKASPKAPLSGALQRTSPPDGGGTTLITSSLQSLLAPAFL